MISLIIPIYNAAHHLTRCLESVLSQTTEDWEAILINDGSTDNSSDICMRYAYRDHRFRFFSQNNCGVSTARNTGLNNVRGEWVCFLDSDDYLPKDALQTYFRIKGHKDYDLIIGGYEIYDSFGIKSYGIEERVVEELDRDSAISLMYHPTHYRYLGYICSKLFKTSVIQTHNIRFNPTIKFNEDRLFTTQFMSASSRFLFFTTPVYYYFEHPGSVMASLKSGFNKNYMTDLDAMVLMRNLVAEHSPANLKNATEGIAESYWNIQWFMNQFHANTIKRLLTLHVKLLHNLSSRNYIKLVIVPFFKKAAKRVFKR